MDRRQCEPGAVDFLIRRAPLLPVNYRPCRSIIALTN